MRYPYRDAPADRIMTVRTQTAGPDGRVLQMRSEKAKPRDVFCVLYFLLQRNAYEMIIVLYTF